MSNKWAVFIGVLGLIVVYVFQRQLFPDPLQDFMYKPASGILPRFNTPAYIAIKTLRYVANDGFALLIIWGLFGNKQYMRFAVAVFLFGLLLLLPLYLVLVLNFYTQTYSFLNHLHRLVLNPVLMMLLIPAFYYQKSLEAKSSDIL
jgi:exosortase F-associated protein